MKAVKVIKKFLIALVIIVFFTFAIIMTIFMLNINKFGLSQFDATTILPIKENITSDNYKKGDLVVLKKPTMDQLNKGDELFVYRVLTDGSVEIEFGKVGEVYLDDRSVAFENGSAFGIDYIAGGVDKVYNGIGSVYGVVQSKWGFLFIVLLPSFLIFVYEIFALVMEIKYGKNEDENPV